MQKIDTVSASVEIMTAITEKEKSDKEIGILDVLVMEYGHDQDGKILESQQITEEEKVQETEKRQ